MKKVYLVDSENVGDIWVPLLVSSQQEDIVLVFYTQKSPHMNYENVRMLKETEKTAEFVKCFEGNNALDFQLVTELGYRLREDAECEYIIVSNDTGFDAVVRYWSARKMPVSRLSGKECAKQIAGKNQQRQPSAKTLQEETPQKEMAQAETSKNDASRTETLQEDIPQKDTPQTEIPQKDAPQEETLQKDELQTEILQEDTPQGNTAQTEAPKEAASQADTPEGASVEEMVRNLCRCISKDSLADFHNALIVFFGEEKGKALYQEIKGNPDWNAYWSEIPECSQREKFDIYCKMVFAQSELAKEYPEDFSAFLFKANGKRKNLNSLRAALQGHYGKEKGMKYYSLIKTHIKIVNRM